MSEEVKVERVDPWTTKTTTTNKIGGLETKVTMTAEEGYARQIPKKFVHPQKHWAAGGFNKKAYDENFDKIDWSK